MSATPEPPRPPQGPPPPAPPRTSGNLVVILLLVLGLIVVVSIMSVWLGFQVLSHNVNVRVQGESGGKKEVSIQTPVGSMKVTKEVDPADIGLPIYPGAVRLKEHDSASVNFELPGDENVQVAAVKFETDDGIEKVKEYYRQQLGDRVTQLKNHEHRGETVFEIKRHDEEKIVSLKTEGSRTLIALVRILHAVAKTTN